MHDHVCICNYHHCHIMQGAAKQGGMKPQLTSAVHAETSMNHKATVIQNTL